MTPEEREVKSICSRHREPKSDCVMCNPKVKEREVELKKCPFCGENLIQHTDHHGKWFAHKEEMGSCIISHMQLFDEKDYIIWNTRKQPTDCPIRRVYEDRFDIGNYYQDDIIEDLWQAVKESLGER